MTRQMVVESQFQEYEELFSVLTLNQMVKRDKAITLAIVDLNEVQKEHSDSTVDYIEIKKEMVSTNLIEGLARLRTQTYSIVNGFIIVKDQPDINCTTHIYLRSAGWFIDIDGYWAFALINNHKEVAVPEMTTPKQED